MLCVGLAVRLGIGVQKSVSALYFCQLWGELMSDISVLDSRIRAALERARRGVDAISVDVAPPSDPRPVESIALRKQLDEERTVNAQLEERVRALKERQDSKLSALDKSVTSHRSQLGEMDREMQRLQQVNAELRAVAKDMREAMMDGVSEPDLINRAILAELEALRAAQSADRAELEVVMAQIAPLLEGAE